ncbi:hypothetical protein ABZ330_16490 [Streptomyces sp. NPDC006172]|uniref:hypothetical protein n=1 Tax=Streptomyces sp. NPDC006172 TaxID=3154470 RepID=UPI0033F61B70
MANTPKKLYRGTASTTQAVVYTVPASTSTIVTNLVAANSGTSAASLLIRIGGIAIVPNTPIPANGIFTLDVTQVLDASTTIDVQASATTVGVHISGVEVTA